MGPLNGKAVIITGSGRGIGAACAKYIARLGGAVVVNDVDATEAEATAAAIRSAGGKAVAHVADITSWSAAGGLIDRCVSEFGAIDGLVNNAGLFSMGRLDEMTDGGLRRLLEVNVVGTANCAAHAVKPMLARGTGSIVNVTSGAHMGIPGMSAYGATKGAVASFTYTWAMELQGTGVRVNAMSPLAETRMGEESTAYARARGIDLPKRTDMPGPEANAPLIAFLVSDDARNVTGQIVRIEGRQLGLVAHPGIALPVIDRDAWDFESVRDAFRDSLAARQLPLGIVGLKVEFAGAGSAYWAVENKS
ncbi:MAG: SDR family NAD(P)-dependent oxidoreductase [Gammaproteobacteria bacterium]